MAAAGWDDVLQGGAADALHEARAQADSDWSDYEGDDDGQWHDEAGSEDEDELGQQHPAPRAQTTSSNAGGGMPARSIGGRPPTVVMSDDVLRWLCCEEYSNAEIAHYFGATVAAVDHRKRRLGLTKMRAVELPTREELDQIWQADPRTAVADVATKWKISTSHLRRHFAKVGFSPRESHGYDVVLRALCDLLRNVDMRAIGVTFATGMLFSERGIIARECDVHRALREYDPTSYAKRVKEASKTQYVYNVSTGRPHPPPELCVPCCPFAPPPHPTSSSDARNMRMLVCFWKKLTSRKSLLNTSRRVAAPPPKIASK